MVGNPHRLRGFYSRAYRADESFIMIQWTDEQKAKIWRLYSEELLSFAAIANRYSHLGATRYGISGLIGRIHKARDAEVEGELDAKKRFNERRAPRKRNERRVINLKQTKEEMAEAKRIWNKVRDE